MNDKVLLIDLSSIAHPIWHVSQKEPDPDHTSQRTAAIVRQLASDHPHTAVCCDSPVSFRKDIDETYKANRPTAEAPLLHQIDLAREALAADGFAVWKVDEFEGDDLIATACAKLRELDHDVLIASADKDLLALVSEKVEFHSTRTGNRVGIAEVKDKLGVLPAQVTDYLTLVGDASDNIRGAKGIGPKTAAGLLDKFGSLDEIYRSFDNPLERARVNDVASVKSAQRESLEELRTRLDDVRALVTMRTDVPIDVSEVLKPRVPTATEDFMEGETKMETPMNPAPSVETDGEFKRRVEMEMKAKTEESAPTASPVETAAPVAIEPAPAEWEHGLEPRSMMEARQLSKWMFESRMFSAYGTQQSVLSTMLLGRELGMPAMAALRSVHIIEGKHSLSADLMVALVLKSGLAEYFQLIESDGKICTFETKRKGAPEAQRLSYTIGDADKAGLLGPTRTGKPSNWDKMPKLMLRARCKSELARLEYPDLLAGLYTPEELRDAKNGD